MMDEEVKKRVVGLYLAELTRGKLEWYFISMLGPEKWEGGFFIEARGPTEALLTLHRLDLYVPGCQTQTTGPFPKEVIPKELRWRKLTEAEVASVRR